MGKEKPQALSHYKPAIGLLICLRLHFRAGSLHHAQPAAAQASQEERRATKRDRRSCSRTAPAAWLPRTAAEGKALLNKELSLHVHSTNQLNEPKYGTLITEKRISSAPFQEPHRPRLLMSATSASSCSPLCKRQLNSARCYKHRHLLQRLWKEVDLQTANISCTAFHNRPAHT